MMFCTYSVSLLLILFDQMLNLVNLKLETDFERP